jgi:hypothetical protein
MEAFENGLEYSGAGKMKQALDDAPVLPDVCNQSPSPKVAEEMIQWGVEYNDWYNNQRIDSQQLNSNNEAGLQREA